MISDNSHAVIFNKKILTTSIFRCLLTVTVSLYMSLFLPSWKPSQELFCVPWSSLKVLMLKNLKIFFTSKSFFQNRLCIILEPLLQNINILKIITINL